MTPMVEIMKTKASTVASRFDHTRPKGLNKTNEPMTRMGATRMSACCRRAKVHSSPIDRVTRL